MIQVSTGSVAEFNAMAFGEQHPNTLTFLQNQMQTMHNMSNVFVDSGNSFITAATNMYEKFNGLEAMRIAKAAIRKVSHIFQSNSIRSLWEIGDFQQAPIIMQRYILAQPDVRSTWLDQRCDGYSGSYVNMHGNDVGEDHYDYRRVMTGIVQDVIEDGEVNWKSTIYFDQIVEGDRELTMDEKSDILNTWDAIAYTLKRGKEDPTSSSNALL